MTDNTEVRRTNVDTGRDGNMTKIIEPYPLNSATAPTLKELSLHVGQPRCFPSAEELKHKGQTTEP